MYFRLFHAYRKYGRGLNGLDTAGVEVRPYPGEDPEAVHEVEVLLVDDAGAGRRRDRPLCEVRRGWGWRGPGQLVPDGHQGVRVVLDLDTLPHNQSLARILLVTVI